MENFCRKSCNECTWKEQLNCPGCQSGPGRALSGDCKIAKCCREKGHETCYTCSFWDGCRTKKDRDRMPELRIRDAERRSEERRKLDERAPVLGKWLWLLFWLVIPGVMAGVMTQEKVVEWIPALEVPGHILDAVCQLAYGLILLKLAPVTQRYRASAYCCLADVGMTLVVTVAGLEQSSPLWWLLMLPAAAVGLASEYQEYHAHADVLEGADAELSGKWRTLWKWYIGSMAVLLGCVLVVLIAPAFGLFVMLAALIAIVVVGIMKLVYLYRTAQWFRSHEPEERKVLPSETAF